MAIAAVTATKLTSGTGNNASGAISATAGSALFVGGSSYHASNGTVAWTAARTGDTYTTDKVDGFSSSPNLAVIGLASAPNVAGGSVTMTVTSTGSTNGLTCYVFEASGLATASILDATLPAVKTGTSTTSTSNSVANTTADAIFVAINTSTFGSTGGVDTNTGTGFSDVAGGVTMKDTDGNSEVVIDLAYKIVSSVVTNNGAWTTDNVLWAAEIGVYKAAAAAGSTASPRRALTGVGR